MKHFRKIVIVAHLIATGLPFKGFSIQIGMRRNPLTVGGLSFQMLSFYCQSISFGLEMKSFIVQRKYNFQDKRKKIVCYNLIRNVHKPNIDKCELTRSFSIL